MNRKYDFGGVGYIIEALKLSPIITPTLISLGVSIRPHQGIENRWGDYVIFGDFRRS